MRAGSSPSPTADYRIFIDLPWSNRVSEDRQHSGEINMKCACVFFFQINLSIMPWGCPFPPDLSLTVYQNDFSPSLRSAFLPSSISLIYPEIEAFLFASLIDYTDSRL